ncbi:sulfatase-like hydrolase/transferase [Reichenbachiella carrageenanivorans]|uniref:Sulfatase-like hydrolase/transferase n=1 Tax=Reichenbachiella carrageenanivorans TaxID=2979869 RepID=A0ABY6D0X8_9BACT|nr:sulfatase-like hydrolase/transferase [Reichenbachiella carrageenanivorans]UXX79825.1 sulfatase-like hydrolase/transferase [Reichenbachiella carrageenanivorans]
MMKKRLVILFCFFGGLVHGQQKNVLMIAIDDLKPLLSSYGYDQMHTPNIDRLAAMGTTFLNTSCQQAVCAPSRASLLTGLYPDATEVWDLSTLIRDKKPDVVTLPQYFKNNGYTTTGAGKLYDPRSVDDQYDAPSWSQPYLHAVDKAYYDATLGDGYAGYQDSRVPQDDADYEQYLTDHGLTSSKDKNEAIKLFPFAKPTTECLDVPDNAYKDGATAAYIVEKLETLAQANTPFLLAAGFSKPHLPFVAPQKYWELYDRDEIVLAPDQTQEASVPGLAWRNNGEMTNSYSDVPLFSDRDLNEDEQKKLIHGYMASVSYADAQVGKVLDKLDDLGLTSTTTIVFWGDHGWHLGDHNLWGKHSNLEQAVRSPMIIYDPDHGTGGSTSESPVELVDIYPTLSELAGLEVSKSLQGRSLVKILDDPTYEVREAALSQFHRNAGGMPHMGYTLRSKQYRYTKWVQMDYENGERHGTAVGYQLYDLVADPTESNNLIGDEAYDAIVDQFELEFKRRNIAQPTLSGFVEVGTCEASYTSPDGSVYGQSGIYTNTLTAKNGMDSVLTIDLTVATTIDETVDIALDEGRLSTTLTGYEYQWWDCVNDAYIALESSSSYAPAVSGSYAVEISNGGCTAISACVEVEVKSDEILGMAIERDLSVYPVPVRGGLLHIDLPDFADTIDLQLVNMSGKVVYERRYYATQSLTVNGLVKGFYLLRIQAGEVRFATKVVVE